MATLKSIQFKRSKTPGAKPTAAQLDEGELAINLRDRTIFTKSDQGQIIDLGFAKGGQVDGDVTINGTLRINGPLNNFGNFSTSGSITAGTSISAQTFRALQGSFYARAPNDTSNAHLWLENADGVERGVIYARPQTTTDGEIRLRVRQGTGSTINSEFYFRSINGGEFQANRILASDSLVTKRIAADTVIHGGKAFGVYDSESLVNYVYPGTGETNGVNYLRRVRAKAGGTIYHEICTSQTGQADEVSWWTGNTPTSKQYGIRNDGRMIIRNSLAIGTMMEGFPSSDYGNVGALGTVFLALGDNGTGLVYRKTGVYDLVGSGNSVASITPDSFRSTRKGLFGRSEDQGTTWIMPGTNAAFLSVQTQADVNNAGDGQTHIGYNSGGKMSHYFRGKGQTNINTQEGMEINPGILKLVTGANNVRFYADGGITSTKQLSIYNGVYLAANNSTAGLTFSATTTIDGSKQILWEGGTRPGQNKSYVTVKAWGNAFNTTGDKYRETVFEVSDGQGYHFYSQRGAPTGDETTGPVLVQVSGSLNARGTLNAGGNLYVGGLSTHEGAVAMNNGLNLTGGSSITGQVKIGGTADALRIWNAEYGAIFRRSESSLYIIPTPKDAGESGGISNLRPLTIELNTGTVKMAHDVHLGDSGSATGLLQVSNSLKTIKMICPVTINERNAALTLDSPSSSSANYLQGSKAGIRSWYVGLGGSGSDLSLYSQTYGHGLVISDNFVSISKPLKVGNAQLGTDGNITNGSGNFANLNTTLNRKVNSGFITYGATAGWYKFATVTMPQSTSTVSFTITGGKGFNTGLFTQCAITEIVLRTGNDRPAGLNAVMYTRTAAGLTDIAVVNTSGNTYDIYVESGTYANQLAYTWHTVDNATVEVIGAFGPTQDPVDSLPVDYVKGQVANMLNNLVDTGKVKRYEADSEIAINNQTGIRIRSNYDKEGSNALVMRNDGGSFYILMTDKNATDGAATVNGDWNSLRPFAINMTSGEVSMNNGIVVRNFATFYNDIVLKDNGHIHFNKSGANPRNMSIFHSGDGTRGNRIEIADDDSWLVYWEKTPAGANRSSYNQCEVSGITTLNVSTKVNTPQTGAFGVNTTNGFGGNSIVIGDSDTGFRQVGDGLLEVWTNAARRMRFQSSDTYSDMNINAPNVYIRSDIRLKSNFKPIENALEKVEQLDGLIYDKADYIGGEVVHTEAGVIAQSLEEVLPEAIREVEDIKGNKVLTVSTQAQVALLIEAVKTLSAKVRELEAKLN